MTLEEAKEYYVDFCCAEFHMFREDPTKYGVFKALNISKEIKKQWGLDELYRLLTKIIEVLENHNQENSKEALNLFKKIRNYINEVEVQISNEDLIGMKNSTKSLFGCKFGLCEFYIWHDDYDERCKLNNDFKTNLIRFENVLEFLIKMQ